tara:strand:- start:1644 stop:1865 length:222 start_codon:yes stop_codon:yes gene_type:complete
MVHLDVSVIQILRGVQVDIDDTKEWIATIIILPIFIVGFIVLYVMMVVTSLVAMAIDWWVAIPYQRRNGKKKT